jgi:hypothetical protein
VSRPLRTILAIRLGAGLVGYLVPQALSAPLGGNTGSAPLMTRLFAVRDAGYALSIGLTPPAARRRLLQVGIATDLADAFASALHLRSGRVSKTVGVGATISALAAACCGALALGPHTLDRPVGEHGNQLE